MKKGAKAIVCDYKANTHDFPVGIEVKFLFLNHDWYMFVNEKNGMKQVLTENQFKWVD